MVLNEQKIVADSRWDGLHGIITNDTISTPEELLSRYRQLWIIEESFRLNKHTLAMRPIYHFKPERIKAHILICYLAFAVSRYTQHQLRACGISVSIDKLRDALSQVEATILTTPTQTYRMPSKLCPEAAKVYRALAIKRSLDVTPIL